MKPVGQRREKFQGFAHVYLGSFFFFFLSSQIEGDVLFQAYFILDDLLLGGEVMETSKKSVLKAVGAQDMMQEVRCSMIT